MIPQIEAEKLIIEPAQGRIKRFDAALVYAKWLDMQRNG
jgi:hypothetical protein